MARGKLPVGNAGRIVFYRTQPIDLEARSGSGLRPAKLLLAFRDLGYDVDLVAGYARERARAIEDVKRKLEAGAAYDFLYAEPPTTPVMLNETHHLPTHPLLDYRFLSRCHAAGMPIVLFYSDVQWRLPDYPRMVGWHKYLFALPFFHLDLQLYRRVVDAWLVPDLHMLGQIASWIPRGRSWASVPGYDPREEPPPRPPVAGDAPIRLFYVGGVQPPVYDLAPLLAASAWAVAHGVRHTVTICAREPEWLRRPRSYDQYLGDHVRVVHNRTRRELLELYVGHDIAVMPYGTLNSDWAQPIKFPEAIGMEVPVLAGVGTAVGETVEREGIGWVVGKDVEDLARLLATIDRGELERVRRRVIAARPRYSWSGRAREIAEIAASVRVAEPAVRPA